MIRQGVELSAQAYPIWIAESLLQSAEIKPHLSAPEIFIIVSQTVAALYLKKLLSQLTSEQKYQYYIVPDGEGEKSLERWWDIQTTLLTHKFTRHTLIVAFGGGVIGDLAGFVAATYQRGVPLLQIPTTLLAMVDSSVGGKTAINHPLGKNLIGAFYQPQAVWIDPGLLHSLPQREYFSGLAEVVKYGFIYDCDFLMALYAMREKLLTREPECLEKVIARCCEIKATIVAQDEREQGVRALLNFGHTFGHAIEKVAGFGTVLHGEAVAIGMRQALMLSYRCQLLSEMDYLKGLQILQGFGFHLNMPEVCKLPALWEALTLDKKHQAKRLRFVLLKQLGQASVETINDQALIEAVMRDSYASEDTK